MLFEKLKTVRAFAFDVDGVLTKGEVLVTEEGQQLRVFNIRDGYALQLAVKRGYPVVAITGAKSAGIRLRMEGLGIRDVYLGVDDKIAVFRAWLEKRGIAAADVLYMGDDIPDLIVMQHVGVATCPQDAIEEIKAVGHYISPKKGGEGAVRDVIEKVLKLQLAWDDDTSVRSS